MKDRFWRWTNLQNLGGDICEKDKKKVKLAWIDKVHKQRIKNANNVEEINVTEKNIVEEIKN